MESSNDCFPPNLYLVLKFINGAVKRFEVSAHVSILTFVPFTDLAFQVGILMFQAAHPFQIVAQAAIQELHCFLFIAVEDPFVMARGEAVQRSGGRRHARWWDTN